MSTTGLPTHTRLRALNPTEHRHHRYLDALHAFRTCTNLDMFDGEGGGAGGGAGGGEGGGAGSGEGAGQGGAGAGGSGGGSGGAGQGDPGYPASTPVAEMTDAQQAAYYKAQSKKHEGRLKSIAGDRPYDDIKKDLDDYAEIKRQQQTPSEQAVQASYDKGRADAEAESATKAARAILRANLVAQGYTDDDSEGSDLNQALAVIDLNKFVKDGDVDTALVSATAARFTSSVRDTRRRDFGGGTRGDSHNGAAGAAGAAQADKRFGPAK